MEFSGVTYKFKVEFKVFVGIICSYCVLWTNFFEKQPSIYYGHKKTIWFGFLSIESEFANKANFDDVRIDFAALRREKLIYRTASIVRTGSFT